MAIEILTPQSEYRFYEAGTDGREKSFLSVPRNMTKGFAKAADFVKLVAFGDVADELHAACKGGKEKVSGIKTAVPRVNKYDDNEMIAVRLDSGTFDPLYAARLGIEVPAVDVDEDEIPI